MPSVEESMTQKNVVNNSFYDAEGYRASIRRQNRFVGASILVIAGIFFAAYVIMGLSFTPSNIGIFGDESSMKGGSGEVGLDADNGVTQSIVDEEVIGLEKSERKTEGHILSWMTRGQRYSIKWRSMTMM